MTTKLKRAQEHMEYALKLIQGYLSSSPIRLDMKPSECGEWSVVYISDISRVDNVIPIAIGDALFNFRSSLDHLMMEIVAKYCSPEKTKDDKVYFPIKWSEENFSKWKSEDSHARQLPASIIETLDALKPYRHPNGLLETLDALHNIDKHRYLVCAAINYQSISLLSMLSNEARQQISDIHLPMMSDLWINDKNCRQAIQVGQEITRYPKNETPGKPLVKFNFSIIEPCLEIRPAINLLNDINIAVIAAHEALRAHL